MIDKNGKFSMSSVGAGQTNDIIGQQQAFSKIGQGYIGDSADSRQTQNYITISAITADLRFTTGRPSFKVGMDNSDLLNLTQDTATIKTNVNVIKKGVFWLLREYGTELTAQESYDGTGIYIQPNEWFSALDVFNYVFSLKTFVTQGETSLATTTVFPYQNVYYRVNDGRMYAFNGVAPVVANDKYIFCNAVVKTGGLIPSSIAGQLDPSEDFCIISKVQSPMLTLGS